MKNIKEIIIMGCGPAGLAAGYHLARKGIRPCLFDKDTSVGGLSKTVHWKGNKFNLGEHRFYTKYPEVLKLWKNILPRDLKTEKCVSRTYYNNKFLEYKNLYKNLGFNKTILCFLSYAKTRVSRRKSEETFEELITNRFGRKFFEIFFKDYIEKTWGLPCGKLSPERRTQGIKDFPLITAIKNSFENISPSLEKAPEIKTAITEPLYPKKGPGQLYEKIADYIKKRGGKISLNTELKEIEISENRITKAILNDTEYSPGEFISSIPLNHFIGSIASLIPQTVRDAAKKLKFRNLLKVVLIYNKKGLFPDNWIYINNSNVKVVRIQNFNNWSKVMTVDRNSTMLGLEYFCGKNDDIWNSTDNELINLGLEDLEKLNLAKADFFSDGIVYRVSDAYPIDSIGYKENLKVVREYLDNISNLHLAGRAGTFGYDNMSYSVMTGIRSAKNILAGKKGI